MFFSLKITALHCVYFRLFPIQFFARIPKGMGSGSGGGGGGGEGVQKLDIFHGCHKCMVLNKNEVS